MPFSSQFSLSLELTHLIPRAITDRVNAGISELLTAIIRSGSDPETERLTMEVFGRNKIEQGLERTFKEVTQISTRTSIFQQSVDVVLEAGAGPTLQRALSHPGYLATAIQLSMFFYCHNVDRLGDALRDSMRMRLEGLSPESQIYPEKDKLKRFIKHVRSSPANFHGNHFSTAFKQQSDSMPKWEQETGITQPIT